MAVTGTVANSGNRQTHTGVAGTNDNDVVIETGDVSNFNMFELKADDGAMDVFVDLGDGTFVGPVSLADLGATSVDPVIVTAADRLYGFVGNFARIQAQQNGATAVGGAVLRCSREI